MLMKQKLKKRKQSKNKKVLNKYKNKYKNKQRNKVNNKMKYNKNKLFKILMLYLKKKNQKKLSNLQKIMNL